MRISRANYDKPHRCPGWSGPAGKASPDISRCDGGSLAREYAADSEAWKRLYKPHYTMYRCTGCGLRVLPFALRKLEPSYWFDKLRAQRIIQRAKEFIA